MLDIATSFVGAFATVFQPVNLLALVVGLVVGMLVAVLPGLTLVMGVVLALPFTYGMSIMPSIILLTAMYISGTYGGAFTAILFRIPGEPLDVPLLWDGYTMAHKGQPAKALGWTLFAAFYGGILSTLAAVAMAPAFAKFALRFDAPEYFAIILFGLTSVVALSGASIVNGFISLFLGLLIATVGVDGIYGAERFTFGVPMLADGIEYLTVMVGAYGVGEVLVRLEQGFHTPPVQAGGNVSTRPPGLREAWAIRATIARSSILGIILGIIPGAGATIASFVAYGTEAQYSKRGKLLGTGVAEGIVAPQTASTATVAGHMVPLITLGIPGSGATAVILGAFLLHGVQPGPQVFVKDPGMVYAIFASLFVGVIGMCLLGFFAIKALIKVLYLPEAATSAFVVMFCFIGAFSERNNITDLWMIVIFGIIGYVFERSKFPIAPMVLGCILGDQAESSFMTSMISYQNDWTVFFTRPISGVVMAMVALALAFPLLRHRRQRRSARGVAASRPTG
ncbi:MAG TPA: tripartite tricarboxylate transporter permease [Casimicrobiaceae bacterium]|jgi:putative tricarboxylic transport membrane protein|nr:tripartite tricarboxylate transporter permease [Casimicrobiaceae bacterium]